MMIQRVRDHIDDFVAMVTSALGHGRPRRGRFSLTVLIEPDEDDGGYVSSIVELPGIASQGETEEEALDNVLDALRCALDVHEEPIPAGPAPHEAPASRRVLVTV